MHEPNITSDFTEVPTTNSPSVDISTTSTAQPDTTPMSVHAFCSDKHAGVKWMVHKSNQDHHILDSEKIDSVTIEFQCQTPEGNLVTKQ